MPTRSEILETYEEYIRLSGEDQTCPGFSIAGSGGCYPCQARWRLGFQGPYLRPPKRISRRRVGTSPLPPSTDLDGLAESNDLSRLCSIDPLPRRARASRSVVTPGIFHRDLRPTGFYSAIPSCAKAPEGKRNPCPQKPWRRRAHSAIDIVLPRKFFLSLAEWAYPERFPMRYAQRFLLSYLPFRT